MSLLLTKATGHIRGIFQCNLVRLHTHTYSTLYFARGAKQFVIEPEQKCAYFLSIAKSAPKLLKYKLVMVSWVPETRNTVGQKI